MRRFAAGIAFSVVAHLLVMANVTLRTATESILPSRLQVRLEQDAAAENATDIAITGASTDTRDFSPARIESEIPVPEKPAGAPPLHETPVRIDLPFDGYFTARDLDVRANQINEVVLIYPKQAYDRRIDGKVVLRMFINEGGGVDRILMEEATPPGVFEETALTAAQALQFTPALKSGRRVKSQKVIEVVFNPYRDGHLQ